jgi:dsRNA-specific ribonuclease
MVAGECIASGSGKSKREAEQVAARSAYDILKPQVVDEGHQL